MKRFFVSVAAAIAAVGIVAAKAIGPREFGLLAGLGLVGFGAGMVWLPAGLVIPGAVLLYVSIFGLG